MPKAWEKLDLHGAGLQSLQIRLRKLQKKPQIAWALWILFALGAHRFYLQRPLAWLYPMGSLLLVIVFLTLPAWLGGVGILILLAFALWDLRQIPDWLAQYNKKIRTEAWFAQQSAAASETPPETQASAETSTEASPWEQELKHYTQVKESERGGHQKPQGTPQKGFGPGQRRMSFAEQERLLAELSQSKKDNAKDDPPQP